MGDARDIYMELVKSLALITNRINNAEELSSKLEYLSNSKIKPYNKSIQKNKKLRKDIRDIRWNVVNSLYREPYSLSCRCISGILGCSISTVSIIMQAIKAEEQRVANLR